MTAPPHANSDGTAVADPRVFSIEGRGLKLDSEADVKSIVDGLNARSDWEEVRLSGNTFGTPGMAQTGGGHAL